mgnify:CR=1 FL=1
MRRESEVMACLAGQRWTWDDVRFTVLHPTARRIRRRAREDQRSLVRRARRLGVRQPRCSPAIIEAKSEALLLRTRSRRAARRRARRAASWFAHVVLTGVHRRRRASRSRVFACGYRNRFGHPRPDIVARYDAASVRTMRTDLEGAITLSFAPQTPLLPVSAREQRQRYWMDPPVPDRTYAEPASAE